MTINRSSVEAITNDSQGEYLLLRRNDSRSPTKNCSHGTLHEDTFILHTNNFTTTKNGYYWCQIVVNGSFRQPSQYARFYADDSNSCIEHHHFKRVNEGQCANATYSIVFPPVIFTTSTTPTAMATSRTTTIETTEYNKQLLFYVVGILSILVLFFGSLVVLILLMFVYKRHREHKQKNDTGYLGSAIAIHPRVSNTLPDSREDDTYSVVSDTSVGITTIVKNTDTEQDHTYDAAEFHTHTNNIDKHPQYNTLQRENTANTQIISNLTFDTYNKIDNNTSKDVQKCSNLSMQFQRSTQTTDSVHEYDEVDTNHAQRENKPQTCETETDWTHKAVPLDYEPVYYGLNDTQVESTGEHVLFDDEMYGTHPKSVSNEPTKQFQKDGVESTSRNDYSEVTTVKTVKTLSDNRSIANKEVEYAEPLPPNIKSPTQDAQAKDEHFYHSLEHNEPTKAEECNSGVPICIGSSNAEDKDNTSVSNNQHTSAELAAMPTKIHVTADTKYQTQPLTSLTDSTQTLDEVGTTKAPILFTIDQCEFDDPMYESVPHSVPKPSSMSSDLINEKMQTVQHILSQEEVPCRDVNDDPDMLNHAKDIESYANAPEYSDPVVPECVDDDMANDQREAKDPKVDIYNTFDDTYA